MAKEEVGKFFEELGNNKEAMDAIAAKNPETIEALAEITGGFAREQGYQISSEQILAYYDERLRLIKERTEQASSELADKDMEAVSGGVSGYYEFLMCSNPTMEWRPETCSGRQDEVVRARKCSNRQDGIVKYSGYGRPCDNRQNARR